MCAITSPSSFVADLLDFAGLSSKSRLYNERKFIGYIGTSTRFRLSE